MENNEKPLKNIFAVEKEYQPSEEEKFLANLNSQMSDPATESNKYGGAGIQDLDEARDSYAYNLFAPDNMKKESKYYKSQILDQYTSNMAVNILLDAVGGAAGNKVGSVIKDKRIRKLLEGVGPNNEDKVKQVVNAYLDGKISYKQCLEKITKLTSDDIAMANPKRGAYTFADALGEKNVKTSETVDNWIDKAVKSDDTWVSKAKRMQEAAMPDDLPEHVYGVTKFAKDTLDSPYVAKWLGYENGKVPDDVKDLFTKAAQVHDWGKTGTNVEALNSHLNQYVDAEKKLFRDNGYGKMIAPHSKISGEYLSKLPDANVPFGLEGDTIQSLAAGHHPGYKGTPKTKLEALLVLSDILDAKLQKRVYKDGGDPVNAINELLVEANDNKWIQDMPEDVKEAFVHSILNSLDEGGYNSTLPKSSLADVYHNKRVDYVDKAISDKPIEVGTAAGVGAGEVANIRRTSVWDNAKNVANNMVAEHKTRVNVYDTVHKGFPGVVPSNVRKGVGFVLDDKGVDHDGNVAGFLSEKGLQKCYGYLVRMNENLQTAKISSAKKEAVQSVIDNWNSLSDADKVYLLRQISKNPVIRRVVNGKDYKWD